MEKSEKDKNLSFAAGIIAILAVMYQIYVITRYLILVSEYGIPASVALSNITDTILIAVSMVLCIVCIFGLCGRKQSILWGISSAILAGIRIYHSISLIVEMRSYISDPSLPSGGIPTVYVLHDGIILAAFVILSIVFTLIAIKYIFENIKYKIQALPIIAIVVTILSFMISINLIENDSFNMVDLYFSCFYIFPFLLFAFCSQDKKALKDDDSVPDEQAQETDENHIESENDQ